MTNIPQSKIIFFMQQAPCHKISIPDRIFLKKENINTHTLLLFSHRKDGSIPLDRTTFY